jgi:hypothetical protein
VSRPRPLWAGYVSLCETFPAQNCWPSRPGPPYYELTRSLFSLAAVGNQLLQVLERLRLVGRFEAIAELVGGEPIGDVRPL